MKCRKLVKENGINNVVWFGSYGKNQDGTAKFVGEVDENREYGYNDNGKHENFSYEQQGVCDSLTQRLSIIRGELWYNVKKGLPLFNKVKKKGFIDSYVVQTILEHPDVKNILLFESGIRDNHYYYCNCKILTIYGNLELEI